ncbi:MAG: hypothetical protein JWN70_2313 [Planctomycetaceae bacterium]|nr:hypothetical protein [Planctomycetaceae bacterium]
MKRSLLISALVISVVFCGVFVRVRNRYADSAAEKRFVGSWDIVLAQPPSKLRQITFAHDKTLLFDGKAAPHSRWSVRYGELNYHHSYQVTLMRGMSPLPFVRKTETITWNVNFKDNDSKLNLTLASPVANVSLVLKRR